MYTTLSGSVKSTSRVRIDCNKRRRTRDNALKPPCTLHAAVSCNSPAPPPVRVSKYVLLRPYKIPFANCRYGSAMAILRRTLNPDSVMDKSYFATFRAKTSLRRDISSANYKIVHFMKDDGPISTSRWNIRDWSGSSWTWMLANCTWMLGERFKERRIYWDAKGVLRSGPSFPKLGSCLHVSRDVPDPGRCRFVPVSGGLICPRIIAVGPNF